ncbi:SDR family NAD(P)-dependent oxidoreductase [Leptolyngbya sp. 15MV]|nr:SDR family NAD(P)-dependent oxidoreductase [Leptolyngbya sp. 15MV]
MILQDKVVIITGAGPGMGQAMCRGAAREGAKVVVSARSEDAIAAIVAEIVAAGGEAIAVPCDVSDTAQCQALARAALDRWGRIDGLVNSAYYHPDWAGLGVETGVAATISAEQAMIETRMT